MQTKSYKTPDGRSVTIKGEWDEDIEAFDAKGEKIGALSMYTKEADGPYFKQYVWFAHAQMKPEWHKQGVATACFCFAREEIYGTEMTFHAPSILDRTEIHGNSLSTEGAALVGKLRRLGYIIEDPAYLDEG